MGGGGKGGILTQVANSRARSMSQSLGRIACTEERKTGGLTPIRERKDCHEGFGSVTNVTSLSGNDYCFMIYVENHGLFITILTIEQNFIEAKPARFKAECSL
jgi:hypothetical protein